MNNEIYTSGNVTFQPNCVVKYVNAGMAILYGNVYCNGGSSPSILTSINDNSYGQNTGGSGTPGYDYGPAIWLYYINHSVSLTGLKIRCATTAVKFDGTPGSFTSSAIECSQTGVYVNNVSVTLSSSTVCSVPTPTSLGGEDGSISGSLANVCNTSPSITAQPQNKTVTYGVSPTFTVTTGSGPVLYQWFKGTAQISGATASSYQVPSPPFASSGDTYKVVVSRPCGGLSTTSSSATLTVNKAPLTLTADNKTKQYGLANPTWTYSYSGFVLGDTSSVLSGAPALPTTAATASSTVAGSPYTITAALGTLSAANYTISTANGLLTITAAPLNVTADNKTKATGAQLPAFTGTAATVLAGDNITVNYFTAATGASPAGSYAIVPWFLDPDARLANYSIAINNGTLEIDDAPLIVRQPASTFATPSGSASFTVQAISTAPLNYQWQRNGTDLSNGGHVTGATTATLTVANASANPDQASYTVRVWNAVGTVTSASATLTVADPIITQQPLSRNAVPGASVSFSVAAQGTPTLTYQWSKGNSAISGATLTSLTISSVSVGNAGDYKSVAKNGNNATAASQPATLSVCAIYPIAINQAVVSGHAVGDRLTADFGVNPGHRGYAGDFGWLTWDWDQSDGTLAQSLSTPDSQYYSNPETGAPDVLAKGKYVIQSNGAKNSNPVRDALRSLKTTGREITVLVWDAFRDDLTHGPPGKIGYHVSSFARITLLDYDINGNGWIEFTYQGVTKCDDAVSLPPSISLPTGPLNFTEKAPPKILDSAATLTAPNSPSFEGGTLNVDCSLVTPAGTFLDEDALSITNEGPASGQIGLASDANGTYVTYGGTRFASVSGYLGRSVMTIQFNSAATREIIQTLIRKLTYYNGSSNPSGTDRTLHASIDDGHGLTSNISTETIHVTPVNDLPTLADIPDMTVYAGSGPHTIVLSGITGGGGESETLTVTAISANTALIPNPTITYTSPNSFGSLSFTPAASGADVVTISVTVQDNGGTANGGSDRLTKSFHVTVLPVSTGGNVPPTILLPGPAVSYVADTPPALVDASADVTDPDSPDFHSGALTAQITANGLPEDRLGIRSQGTGSGQIGVSGKQITYEGVVFAMFTGGYSANPLTISFINTAASHEAVRALLRNLTYWNTSHNPSTLARTLQFGMTDEAAAASQPVTKAVNITRVNHPPVANPQVVNVFRGVTKPVLLSGLDIDGDPLTYSVTTPPAHGSLGGAAPNLTYAPNAGYLGLDALAFEVNDGTVDSQPATVAITVAAAAPLAVDAGPNKSGTVGTDIALDGSVTSDGSVSQDQINISWAVTASPTGSDVTFKNQNAAATTASFTRPGRYLLTLTAMIGTDTGTAVSSTMTVHACAQVRRPKDIALVLDRSGLLFQYPMKFVHERAVAFADYIQSSDQIGLVTFSGEVILQHILTSDAASVKNSTVSLDRHTGPSEIANAIKAAQWELTGPRRNPQADKVILLFSPGNTFDPDAAKRASLLAKAAGIRIIVVGLFPGESPSSGDDRVQLLNFLSSSSSDYYAFTDTYTDWPSALNASATIFSEVTDTFCDPSLEVDPGPSLSAVPPSSGPVTKTLQAGVSGGLAPITYSWAFMPTMSLPATINPADVQLSSATAPAPTVTINNPVDTGTYLFQVTVTDGGGVVGQSYVVLSVSSVPLDSFFIVQRYSTENVLDVLQSLPNLNGDTLVVEDELEAFGDPLADSGRFTYAPDSSTAGRVNWFFYSILDGSGNPVNNPAAGPYDDPTEFKASVFVQPANEPPIARPDTYTFGVNSGEHDLDSGAPPSSPSVLANDSDPDWGETGGWYGGNVYDAFPFRITSFTQPTGGHGSVTMRPVDGQLIYTTPMDGFTGTDTFTYTIRDTYGLTATGQVTVVVSDNPGAFAPTKAANDAFSIPLSSQVPSTVTPLDVLGNDKGSPQTIYSVSPTDVGVSIDTSVNPQRLLYTMPGTVPALPVTVTYKLFNDNDPNHQATAAIGFEAPTDLNETAVASITALDDKPFSLDAPPVVKRGFLRVQGTADDTYPGNVVTYRLTAWSVSDDTPVASADFIGRVQDSFLGELDLRNAPNGGYRLDLTVSDDAQLQWSSGSPALAVVSADFFLESDLKIGRFAFSVNDLQVPVQGVPISITRSYDSLDRNAGDFGTAWQLSVGAGQLTKSGVLGQGWTPDGSCAANSGQLMVTVSLGSGEEYRFAPYLTDCSDGIADDPAFNSALCPAARKPSNRLIRRTCSPSWTTARASWISMTMTP